MMVFPFEHPATHCNKQRSTLQHTLGDAFCVRSFWSWFVSVSDFGSAHTTTHCNTLQYTATYFWHHVCFFFAFFSSWLVRERFPLCTRRNTRRNTHCNTHRNTCLALPFSCDIVLTLLCVCFVLRTLRHAQQYSAHSPLLLSSPFIVLTRKEVFRLSTYCNTHCSIHMASPFVRNSFRSHSLTRKPGYRRWCKMGSVTLRPQLYCL